MGYYAKLSFKELMDEYFEARLDYWKYSIQHQNMIDNSFGNEYCNNLIKKDEEIGSILIQNYQEIEAEIERRMFKYESCRED